VVCNHRRGQHPSEPLNNHEERNLVMPHEPSDSRPIVQPIADRRCAPYRPCGAAVALRYWQRALRGVTHRAEASHPALLAQPRGGAGDAA
jgi:hypothetical protein